MDPISQGALGAVAAQTLAAPQYGSLAERNERDVPWLPLTWLGCAAGMAPDLDVFIQSASDPLLFLECPQQPY